MVFKTVGNGEWGVGGSRVSNMCVAAGLVGSNRRHLAADESRAARSRRLLAITDRYRELPAWLTGPARPSPAAEDLALLRTLTSLR